MCKKFAQYIYKAQMPLVSPSETFFWSFFLVSVSFSQMSPTVVSVSETTNPAARDVPVRWVCGNIQDMKGLMQNYCNYPILYNKLQ